MDSNISTPVLLSYRRVHTVDFSYNNQDQRSDTLLIETKLKNSEKKAKCPSRSFSLSSMLPTKKRTGKWTANTDDQKMTSNEERKLKREIERFHHDFVFLSFKSQDIEKQAINLFHSSSFKTETDSGAFSRLSSPDVESDYSDFSDSSLSLDNPALQLCGPYSAVSKKTKKWKSENKTPVVDKTVHSISDCGGTVTVNGVCYHCNK